MPGQRKTTRLPDPAGGGVVMLSVETYLKLREILEEGEAVFDPREFQVNPTAHGRNVTLRNRFQPGGGTKRWTISVNGSLEMSVRFGLVHTLDWVSDASGFARPFPKIVVPTINSLRMTGDPRGAGAGFGSLTLATSTTYGVWVRCTTSVTSTINHYHAKDTSGTVDPGQFVSFHTLSIEEPAAVVVSTTYTDYTHEAGINQTGDGGAGFYAYAYLGKVTIDGSDVATIEQWREDDIYIDSATFPGKVASGDANNDIGQYTTGAGGDDGLWTKVVYQDGGSGLTQDLTDEGQTPGDPESGVRYEQP